MTTFVKKLGRLVRWRPARKGEAGYEQRQYVLKHPKNATEKAKRVSLRQFLQAKAGGKRLEQLAIERAAKRTPAEQAKFNIFKFKKRRAEELKFKYKGEKAKDIHWFERFKAKRMAGGSHKPE